MIISLFFSAISSARSCALEMPSVGFRARGSLVRMIQSRLHVHPDGVFGPETKSAVEKFQSENKLIIDGIVGPHTWNAFPILGVGSSGPTVEKLQRKLRLIADGSFGSLTENAVMDFQRKNGLLDDGIAGPDTLDALGM